MSMNFLRKRDTSMGRRTWWGIINPPRVIYCHTQTIFMSLSSGNWLQMWPLLVQIWFVGIMLFHVGWLGTAWHLSLIQPYVWHDNAGHDSLWWLGWRDDRGWSLPCQSTRQAYAFVYLRKQDWDFFLRTESQDKQFAPYEGILNIYFHYNATKDIFKGRSSIDRHGLGILGSYRHHEWRHEFAEVLGDQCVSVWCVKMVQMQW